MNSTSSCHEVPDCNGIYIDAFYGNYLKTKSSNINNTFILTHYHSDHYRNLPRGSSDNSIISDSNNVISYTGERNRNSNSTTASKGYVGPAQIHCTPITGSLLRSIHNVPSHLIVEHDYGETWTCYCSLSSITSTSKSSRKRPYNDNNTVTTTTETIRKVTFYDANHCPGAAIVVIELPNGIVHIHTGDMRYDPNKSNTMFQRIPNHHQQNRQFLSQHHEKDTISTLSSISKINIANNPLIDAIQEQRIHTVLLDTTYAHPKHNFLSQKDAINTISSSIETILHDETIYNDNNNNNNPGSPTSTTNINTYTITTIKKKKTLILLSCYSIGKEKILWDVSNRTKQQIYVTEKKFKMLQCIQNNLNNSKHNNGSSSSTASNDDVNYNNQCTMNIQQQHDDHYNIINHCTTNPTASNIHVVPMGLAGQLWPYYQPNYWACVEYAKKITNTNTTNTASTSTTQEGANVQRNLHSQLIDDDDDTTRLQQQDQQQEQELEFTNIVAFIPTGWADGSNWNKKHSITSYNCNNVLVEIRLISYSEHSTFNELQQFIQYVQPHTIIPTVYKDNNDRRSIISRFASYINANRVKQTFIQSMTTTTTKTCRTKFQSSTSTSNEGVSSERIKQSFDNTDTESSLGVVDSSKHSNENDIDTNIKVMEMQNNYGSGSKIDEENIIVVDINTDDDDNVDETNNKDGTSMDDNNDEDSIKKVVATTTSQSPSTTDDLHLNILTEAELATATLVTMGFSKIDATNALQECSGNLEQAVEFLLSSQGNNNNNKNDVVTTNCTNTSMMMNDTSVHSNTKSVLLLLSSGAKAKQKSRLSIIKDGSTTPSSSSAVSLSSSSTKNHSIKKFFQTKMK